MGASCSSTRDVADLTEEDNSKPKNKKEEITKPMHQLHAS